MRFYGFETDKLGHYQLLCEIEGEQYCGELERPIKHVLLSDLHSLQATGKPEKKRLQLTQFSDGRQRVIVGLEKLAYGAGQLFGVSLLSGIGTGIAGFFFPPAWVYTAMAFHTGVVALGTSCVAGVLSEKLYTVKTVEFDVLTVNFGLASASSPELSGVSFTGVVPISDFNKMQSQFEHLRSRKKRADEEGFSGNIAMDIP